MATFMTTSAIVLPTFLTIALGYLLRLCGVINEVGGERMNVLSFKVLIPTMLFYNIYNSHLPGPDDIKVMVFAAGSVTFIFVVLMLAIPFIEKDNTRRGVLVQGIFRSSFIVLGLGLVTAMYPNGGTGVTAMLSAVIAPLFNAYGVIALETYSNKKTSIGNIAVNIVMNPLIIGSVLAIVVLLLQVRLPAILEHTIAGLSGTATPLALLVAGASFRFSSIGDRARPLLIGCIGRLLVVPAIFIPLAVWMGFRNVELLSLLVIFASPNAVSSHIMAYNAGGDDQLAGQIVVLSTCFSAITLFGFIYALLSMGLL